MKVFVAHLIVMGILKKNSLEQYWSRDSILDESTCPFKGRVHFKCYNPKKPNRFHFKLFMVSELSTGYICDFEVYTGEASGESQSNAQEVQDVSNTSCTVLGLLDSVQLLDMGHHVYFDNYYNSLDLMNCCTREKLMHVAQSGKTESHSL